MNLTTVEILPQYKKNGNPSNSENWIQLFQFHNYPEVVDEVFWVETEFDWFGLIEQKKLAESDFTNMFFTLSD